MFLLIQYLQRTCERHTQCDAITLEKSLRNLSFLLLQFLQRTCECHAQWDTIFLENISYRPVLFPNSILAEDMRRHGHTQCDAITLEKVSHTCCFSYFSLYTGHANAKLSVMRFFWNVLFTDLFFFLIQYLQRTCDGHNQCDAITLEKSLRNLSFLLLQFLQRTCECHTQWDTIFLENISYRPVLFPNSILAEDMRRPYSVWCNNSRKNLTYLLFSYFSFYPGHANAILSLMQFFSKKLIPIFFLILYLQRTCDLHTLCDAITLQKNLHTCCFSYFSFSRGHANNTLSRTCERDVSPNSVLAEDMRTPYSVWCNLSQKNFYRPVFFPNTLLAEDMRRPYSV